MIILFFPFVAAVAANSFLSLGFGVRRLVSPESSCCRSALGPSIAICVSGAVVWPLFSYALAPFSLGFLEPLSLAPLSVLISVASDAIARRLPLGDAKSKKRPDLSAQSAFDGLIYASSFFFLRYASSYAESLLLALGAVVGYAASDFILRAVRERSDTEAIPSFLRGVPLLLIASGLLAVLSFFFAAANFGAFGRGL